MPHVPFRSFAVALAVALAVGVPTLIMGLHLGLSQAQFAAQGDTTLRAAPYAFAIWGPIYAGLVGYATYQWKRATPAIAAFGWPSVMSALSCSAWIVTSALDLRWASVVTITAGAGAAARGVLAHGRQVAPTRRDLWLVTWPNAVLAGWLLLAAPLAFITVATAEGLVSPAARETRAICGITGTTLASLALAMRSHLAVVLAPVIWGLVAVAIAERAEQPRVALTAGVAAVILSGLAAFLSLRHGPRSHSAKPGLPQRPASRSV